jgi:hypothetical protein
MGWVYFFVRILETIGFWIEVRWLVAQTIVKFEK